MAHKGQSQNSNLTLILDSTEYSLLVLTWKSLVILATADLVEVGRDRNHMEFS